MQKTILLIGANGLIGSEFLKLCLENKNISRIKVLVRNTTGISNPKLIEIITDFQDFSSLKHEIKADAVVFCIGTTRKKTPNLDDYRSIDYGITLQIAAFAKQNGIEEIHLISAIGANAKSSIFYNRLKGEIERDIIALDFNTTCIYRPSLLIGKRKEFRLGELIAQKLAPFFDIILVGSAKKYHSINSTDVAKALLQNLLIEKKRMEILEYEELYYLINKQ
jgi:uncharacterized protein YbjT (DUF2867 family)